MEAKAEAKSEPADTVLEQEQEQILKIMNFSQHGRLEEQCCALSPVKSTLTKGTVHEKTLDNKQRQHLDVKPVSLSRFNYQEPGILDHHGSAPHTSVTGSTPDRNRKLLSVSSNHLQVPSQPRCSTPITIESPEEQDKFMNIICHGQRGRMDDQCCSLDPCKSAPCTPQRSGKPAANINNLDSETFFDLIASTQSQRLDDQRVSLPSLPGIQNENATTAVEGDSSYLCYMVSKVQGSRMDDQRCSLPQPSKAQCTPEKDKSVLCPPRSASFSTKSDTEQPKKNKKSSPKESSPDEQEYFISLMTKSQRGRMDEQRCSLNVSPMSTPAHKSGPSTSVREPDPEKFLQDLVNSQSRRLDDQRVALPSLPGIKNGSTSRSAAEKDASYLCYMVSKVQGSRIDEQRCDAPQISRNLCTPSTKHRDHSVSPVSDKPPQRSASFNHVKADHHPQVSPPEEEEFFKLITHAQCGRMEEQRCMLQPSRSTPVTPTHNGSTSNNIYTGADADAFFNIISSSQGKRLDDQRVVLPTLPGISENTEGKGKGRNTKVEIPPSPPHITVAKSTLTTSRKDCSRPTSQPQRAYRECGSPITLPKSASFPSVTEYQKKHNSPIQLFHRLRGLQLARQEYRQDLLQDNDLLFLLQMTVRVSMSFTPQQGQKAMDQPCLFPEVFLTLGAPGDNLVIPLSPVPGRPLSLNLNLVPREDAHSKHYSLNLASPRKAHSRPSSPNPEATSKTHTETSCAHEQKRACTLSPDEDCFSLIERVHAAQLHRGAAKGRQKWKGEKKKGKKVKKDGCK